MAVLSTRGPMAVLAMQKQPEGQTSRFQATNCIFAIIPHDQFIRGRAKLFSAKASPIAVLSTQGPMAVLSRQKQPDGQTSRFQPQIAFSLLSRAISLSAAGPSYSQQSRPNGRFINARPNGRFIKAEATGWPDLHISATNCIFAIIPHDQFISGRAKLFSAKASPMAGLSTRGPMAVLSKQKQPDGQTSRFQRQIAFSLLSRAISLSAAGPSYSQQKQAFINGRPNGRFMKAEATGWPDLQISATNCIFAIIPHDHFISGRAKLFSAKAAQWPFYQREAQWPFYQEQQPDSQTLDLSRALQVPYYLAQSVYQRPPFSAEASPMAVLSRPAQM